MVGGGGDDAGGDNDGSGGNGTSVEAVGFVGPTLFVAIFVASLPVDFEVNLLAPVVFPVLTFKLSLKVIWPRG